MHGALRDIRYGIRSLAKSPGLTLVAIVALTLGIGLTTAMFSMVYGVLIKGLPYRNGDRIVEVSRTDVARGYTEQSVAAADYVDYAAQQHTLSTIGAYRPASVNVSGASQPARYQGAFVTASFFDVAGVRPVLGRTFRAEENGPSVDNVVVIGYALWQAEFGGARTASGAELRVNGASYTVIGVMPEGYDFPNGARVWLPLRIAPVTAKRDQNDRLTVVGVRKPGVSVDQATADFSAIASRLEREYPATNTGIGAKVRQFVDADVGDNAHQILYSMLGAVFFVLLIACANVANLLLDRAAHRTKEIGIRTALGASRADVVRQFLIEALLLSLGGAALGCGVAYAGIAAFNHVMYASTDIPSYIDISLNGPVLEFAIGMAVFAAMFAGVLPAVQSSRTDINEVLKDETRGSSSLHIGRVSRALVMLEIALSCGLLVAAGLTIKSVTKLKTMNPGYRTSHIFTARVGFPEENADTSAQRRFFEQLADRLQAIPGVRSAALMAGLPGVDWDETPFEVEGRAYASDRDVPNAYTYAVSPRFFGTFGIPVLAGRNFTTADLPTGSPVVIVNQAFADVYLGGGDVLGRRVRAGGRTSTASWMTVVGVVPTTFSGDQNRPRTPAYYVPLAQHPTRSVSIAAFTAGPPMAITGEVRNVVALLDPDLPIYWTYSQDEAMARQLWFIGVFGAIFTLFGFVALFLSALGLYAVMSFSVSRRTREVGIRMALGAQPRDVMRMVVGQGVLQITIGMAAGLAFAAMLAQLLGVVLFQVQPRDPTIFAGVAVVLAFTGLAACLIPARRATAVDPLTALRAE